MVEMAMSLSKKIKSVLVDYLKSQFILMTIVTLMVWGILLLLKVKFALMLAVLTAVFSTVPNYGIITAVLIAGLVATFDNVRFLPQSPEFVEGLAIILILVVLNKLIDIFLSPIVVGKAGKINPLVLLAITLLGTVLFGLPGAILATPIFLVIKTVWEHYI
jgi:putative permease